MTLLLLLAAVVISLCLNIAVAGILLWLVCRLCRIPGRQRPPRAAVGASPVAPTRPPGVSYRRAVVAAALLWAGQLGVVVLGVRLFDWPFTSSLFASAAVAAVSFLLPFLCVFLVLRPPLGKGFLSAFLWFVLTAAYGLGFVLLARQTLFEALILPTGGEAETLWGYHRLLVCPQCGLPFPVNAIAEAEPPSPEFRRRISAGTCPNCRAHVDIPAGTPLTSGDRLLIGKGLFGSHVFAPQRLDLLVFQHPDSASPGKTPANYCKRLVGLPGETLAIRDGHVYVLPPEKAPAYDDSRLPPDERRKGAALHEDDPGALQSLQAGEFHIVRKPPALLLQMRRLVYDHDHPAHDLTGPDRQRWAAAGNDAWAAGEGGSFRHDARAETAPSWLRYRHLLRRPPDAPGGPRPGLITDFLGYNSYEIEPPMHPSPAGNWAGDLMLDCEVQVEQPTGLLVLELSRGVDRFRLRCDLATGVCGFTRQSLGGSEQGLDQPKPTALKGVGVHRLRFANADERLTLWLDNALPFGSGVAYNAPGQRGPTRENDLEPASVGVQGAAVTVRKLQLWRNTYFTTRPGVADVTLSDEDWSDPERWDGLRDLPARTFFVQPGHYFMLGDNSMESADSRYWGLVPEPLLLGKAFLVYYPLPRARILP
jgi:signal peptidase I